VIVKISLFIGKNRDGIVVVLPDTLSFLSAAFAEQSYPLGLAKGLNASRMPGELKRSYSTPTEIWLMTLLRQSAALGKKMLRGVLHRIPGHGIAREQRRHRLPTLYAITLSHSRTSFERNRWQLSRVIFTSCLPSQ
jgi:hypothetical protein